MEKNMGNCFLEPRGQNLIFQPHEVARVLENTSFNHFRKNKTWPCKPICLPFIFIVIHLDKLIRIFLDII